MRWSDALTASPLPSRNRACLRALREPVRVRVNCRQRQKSGRALRLSRCPTHPSTLPRSSLPTWYRALQIPPLLPTRWVPARPSCPPSRWLLTEACPGPRSATAPCIQAASRECVASTMARRLPPLALLQRTPLAAYHRFGRSSQRLLSLLSRGGGPAPTLSRPALSCSPSPSPGGPLFQGTLSLRSPHIAPRLPCDTSSLQLLRRDLARTSQPSGQLFPYTLWPARRRRYKA